MLIDDRSAVLRGLIDQLREGNDSARAVLLKIACDRLERLTRAMLHRDFPRVRPLEQTADVLQKALIQLDNALLDKVIPSTPDEFFGLAAYIIRRELLGPVRHYYGPQGMVQHIEPGARPEGYPGSLSDDPGILAARKDFLLELHRRAEDLPKELRKVLELHAYDGLSLAETAQVLNISTRTARRHWADACKMLRDALGDQIPF